LPLKFLDIYKLFQPLLNILSSAVEQVVEIQDGLAVVVLVHTGLQVHLTSQDCLHLLSQLELVVVLVTDQALLCQQLLPQVAVMAVSTTEMELLAVLVVVLAVLVVERLVVLAFLVMEMLVAILLITALLVVVVLVLSAVMVKAVDSTVVLVELV